MTWTFSLPCSQNPTPLFNSFHLSGKKGWSEQCYLSKRSTYVWVEICSPWISGQWQCEKKETQSLLILYVFFSSSTIKRQVMTTQLRELIWCDGRQCRCVQLLKHNPSQKYICNRATYYLLINILVFLLSNILKDTSVQTRIKPINRG